MSIANILRKSTDFLRRIIAPSGGEGGVTLSYVCPHCHTASGGSRGDTATATRRKGALWWRVRLEAPNRVLVIEKQHGPPRSKKFFGRTQHHREPQKDGDSPVRMIVAGLLGKGRRRRMDGLRSFIGVVNYAAGKILDLVKKVRTNPPCEHMKEVCCVPSSTLECGKRKMGATGS